MARFYFSKKFIFYNIFKLLSKFLNMFLKLKIKFSLYNLVKLQQTLIYKTIEKYSFKVSTN